MHLDGNEKVANMRTGRPAFHVDQVAWATNLCNSAAMNADRERILQAYAARVAAQKEEQEAIMEALRKRSVPQAEIARITGVSTETIRQMRMAADIAADPRKVRGSMRGPIYAFRDEAGTWLPKDHERLLPPGKYAVGPEIPIKADESSPFAGQTLIAMYALERDALPNDSTSYVPVRSGGRRWATKAVHDEIWPHRTTRTADPEPEAGEGCR
jgi:hypothetical protein